MSQKNRGMYESTWVTIHRGIDHRGLKVEIWVCKEAFPILGEIFDSIKSAAMYEQMPVKALNDEWSDNRCYRIISVYPKNGVKFKEFLDEVCEHTEKTIIDWVKRKICRDL